MQPANPLESIFAAAVEISSEEERCRFVEQACAGDTELKQRVDEMVVDHFRAGNFLEPPTAGLVATGDAPIAERPGSIIGNYKLLEQVGEGGFGIVFMAEQQEPIRRKVALKVLKPGMDSQQVIARFEAERQALALMDHPNIAKVLDADQTESGRPYFVMELVKGLPITEFCDQNQLTPKERLELFVHVCQAVQHAHQKGIIHRDIKPSNVLVTLQDGTPLVKVIDFGIAKALGQQLTDKTLFTGFAQMIGTPLYMSPEQAALSNVDVDTRSDIYSLGVLLYELLTGTTPFPKERLKEISYDELRRIIREEEPPRPSTRISTLGKAASTVSTQRKSDPKRLSQSFRGELDWIVMKALDKDRNRRYESASAFAADVQRYLNDEAVQACPPSVSYRFRKFVRRNKGPVLAASIILFVLVAGIVGTSSGMVWALAAEQEAVTEGKEKEKALARAVAEGALKEKALALERQAKREAETAAAKEKLAKELAEKRLQQTDRANAILASILHHVDPRWEEKNEIPIRTQLAERLDKTAELLERESLLDADTVAHQQVLLGRLMTGLGYAEKAIPVLKKARQTFEKPRSGRPPESLTVILNDLAEAHRWSGKPQLALKLYREALEESKETLGLDHERTLVGMNNLALAYHQAGQLESAVPLCLDTLAKLKKIKGEAYHGTLSCMNNLATMYMDAGKLELGLSLYRETLEKTRKARGPYHFDTLTSMNNLAAAYRETGKLDLALPLAVETVSKCKARLGPDHPVTLVSMGNLASAYLDAGKFDLALPLALETLQLRKLRLGADHPDTLLSMNNLATLYTSMDKFDQALPLFRDALEQAKASLGVDHPNTPRITDNLAEAYRRADKVELALMLQRERLQRTKKRLGEDHPDTLKSMRNLADTYRQAHKFDLALPLFVEALEKSKKKLGADHPNTLTTMSHLAQAYYEAGRPDLAGPLAIETLEKRKSKLGADHPDTLTSINDLAVMFGALRKLDLAVPLFEEAMKKMKSRRPDHIETLSCMNNLADAYRMARKFDQAAALFLETLKKEKATIGADHKLTLTVMNNLGLTYHDWGKLDLALPLFVETLEKLKKKLGENDPFTLTALNNLALTYRSKGQADLALPLYIATLKGRRASLGADHPDTLHSMNNLAATCMMVKKYAEAEPLLTDWLAKQRKPPADALMVGSVLNRLGECRLGLKKFAAAEAALRDSIAIYEKKQPKLLRRYDSESLLGAALVGQKKFPEAEPFLVSGAKVLLRNVTRVDAESKGRTAAALDRVIDFYTSRGNTGEAERWRKLRDEAFGSPKDKNGK